MTSFLQLLLAWLAVSCLFAPLIARGFRNGLCNSSRAPLPDLGEHAGEQRPNGDCLPASDCLLHSERV